MSDYYASSSRTTGKKTKAAGKKIRRNRLMHHRLLLRVMVILVVLSNLAGLVSKNRTFSDSENRALAQRPKFSLSALTDGSYFSDLESWFNDQFAGRDRWISLNLWGVKRTGQQEVSGIYLGRGGQLLSDPEEPVADAVSATIEAINSFTTAHSDLNTYMMLVPGAASIQSDALPYGAPAYDQLTDIAAIQSSLNSSITVFPMADILSEHKDEYIYYLTDHHWTSLGAYYAYQSVATAMDLSEHNYEVYPVTDSFEGTLASRSGSHKVQDTIEIYVDPSSDLEYYMTTGDDSGKVCSVYYRDALNTKDKYMVFFNGNHAKVEISTTANNERTLLVFKDSYANTFIPFILDDFEKIIMIDPRYYYDSMDTILNEGVTDVLYLYSADTLVADTSLADVLNAE